MRRLLQRLAGQRDNRHNPRFARVTGPPAPLLDREVTTVRTSPAMASMLSSAATHLHANIAMY